MTYAWNYTGTGETITGGTTESITVDFGAAATSGASRLAEEGLSHAVLAALQVRRDYVRSESRVDGRSRTQRLLAQRVEAAQCVRSRGLRPGGVS